MKRSILIILLSFVVGSCVRDFPSTPDLSGDFEVIDAPTTPLSTTGRMVMSGVYTVVNGCDILGTTIAGKWVGSRWCLYAESDAIFAETAGGASGDSIKLTGYIRTIRSGSAVRVKMKILKDDGAKQIFLGTSPSSIRILGSTEDGNRIELRRIRSIYESPKPFFALAHKGGGGNSDRLGISENSLPMIEHAETFGANGIEIDIRRTRDNKVIVFHDNTFSPRTVQGIYLLGTVEDFDLEQIRMFGRLINGETIPTLSEALNTVIEKTSLKYVWLDTKQPEVVDQAILIQKEAMTHAAALNRDVTILLGMPNGEDEILNAYRNSPNRNTTDVLVEGDIDVALSLPTCRVWAPFWGRDIATGDFDRVHSAGKKVFIWTADLHETIVEYLDKVDGILSNYPSLVTGIHDTKQ
jgi:glycerophosphoryl diester phosphodiesterase